MSEKCSFKLSEEACCKERPSRGRGDMAVITLLSHNRGTN